MEDMIVMIGIVIGIEMILRSSGGGIHNSRIILIQSEHITNYYLYVCLLL